MGTNALELRDLLREVAKKGDEKRVSQAFAETLGFPGPHADIEASRAIALLVRRIESDIDLISDLESQNHAKENFRAFSSLGDLGSFSQLVKNARNNVLKPEAIKLLVGVHAALNGVRSLSVDQEILGEKAMLLSEIAEELAEEDLPEELRLYFYNQLKTVSAILEGYSRFGAAYAEEKLLQLVSAIGLKGQPIKQKSPGLFKRLRDAAFDGMHGIQQADKTLDSIDGIATSETAQKFLESIKGAM